MRKRNLYLGGGAVTLGLALGLVIMPGLSAAPQDSTDARIARMEKQIEELQARLAERLAGQQERMAELAHDRAVQVSTRIADRIVAGTRTGRAPAGADSSLPRDRMGRTR